MTEMIPTWIDGDLVAVEKLEAHERGLRHKAVSVFVLNGDAVLVQRRALGKYHTPGLWANTCCTHPRWGEAPLACARRRLVEELGLHGLPLEPRGQVEYRADVGAGLIEHEVVEVFVARMPERVVPVPNPDEVMAVEWVTRSVLDARIRNAPADFTPWLRIYLRDHAAQIFAGAEKLPEFPA
ncbi:isopentenyl-diphosphate Delta-isomerase [Roseovarius ramblicola]|uniref:Isopentenyl-diphosphate Delta-isomerase n=1 Tax=Roseovarius ramblicola TaxID=2022336 RepID=A0ABV5I3U6_9RHOB